MRVIKKIIVLLSICFPAFLIAQDAWKINAKINSSQEYYGITSANGTIGLLSSPEPLKIKQVVLSGLYDKYGRGRVSNFVSGVNLLNLRLNINGKTVNKDNVENYTQEMNLKNGVFETAFDFGSDAKIKFSYVALRHLPYCVVAMVEIQALKDVSLTATNLHEVPDALRDPVFTFNEINRKHIGIDLLTTVAKSPTGKVSMASSTSFAFTETRGEEPRVYHEMPDNNLHQQKFYKNIKAGETYHFSVMGTYISSVQSPDVYNEAERLTIFASLEGIDRLMNLHNKAWEELWKSDIVIEGDPMVQQEVHSMLYHLYAFNTTGSGLSVSPMGLSGLGYNGHVFWDTETWIFPALLMLHPEMAKNLLDYRFDRLNAARNNAFAHGYKGAMFPWESADSGVEETPVWALSGPFEHHITACIANAAWQYYCVTQDLNWLNQKGWPLISEAAEFWTSRVNKNSKGQCEILNVVAADEYAENVDNDAYTNGATIVCLKNAIACATLLQKPVNPLWKSIADGLVIEKFPDGVTREHKTYQGEHIKQADVNLLAYPLMIIKDTAQIHKDLKYYQIRVPERNTPAMTQAVFSLLYAKINKKQLALHYFEDAYRPNQLPPFGVLAETKGGDNPYFLTGTGGVLQTLIMGFGGAEITSKGVAFKKGMLPEGWKSLTITGIGKDKKTITVK